MAVLMNISAYVNKGSVMQVEMLQNMQIHTFVGESHRYMLHLTICIYVSMCLYLYHVSM